MNVILLLIVASLLMALLFLACFIWSVRSGQYEDTSTPALRVLMEEAAPETSTRPAEAGAAPSLAEPQFRSLSQTTTQSN